MFIKDPNSTQSSDKIREAVSIYRSLNGSTDFNTRLQFLRGYFWIQAVKSQASTSISSDTRRGLLEVALRDSMNAIETLNQLFREGILLQSESQKLVGQLQAECEELKNTLKELGSNIPSSDKDFG